MKQLQAKQAERATVVAKVDLIEKAIDLERAKYADDYARINAEKMRIASMKVQTETSQVCPCTPCTEGQDAHAGASVC
jgi:hypothetical protein